MEEDSTSTVAVVESRAAVSSSEDGPTSRLSHKSSGSQHIHRREDDKIQANVVKLKNELKNVESAITTKEACEKIKQFIDRCDEPLGKPIEKESPWSTSQTPDGCCIIS